MKLFLTTILTFVLFGLNVNAQFASAVRGSLTKPKPAVAPKVTPAKGGGGAIQSGLNKFGEAANKASGMLKNNAVVNPNAIGLVGVAGAVAAGDNLSSPKVGSPAALRAAKKNFQAMGRMGLKMGYKLLKILNKSPLSPTQVGKLVAVGVGAAIVTCIKEADCTKKIVESALIGSGMTYAELESCEIEAGS